MAGEVNGTIPGQRRLGLVGGLDDPGEGLRIAGAHGDHADGEFGIGVADIDRGPGLGHDRHLPARSIAIIDGGFEHTARVCRVFGTIGPIHGRAASRRTERENADRVSVFERDRTPGSQVDRDIPPASGLLDVKVGIVV